MQCFVYKSLLKPLTFLYVEANTEWESLPEALLESFGEREYVLTLALQADTKLALATATDVLASIEERGFYLQLPPAKDKDIHAQIH